MAKDTSMGKEMLKGPLYSDGTSDQAQKKNVGAVEGPTAGKSVPDPLKIAGYKGTGN